MRAKGDAVLRDTAEALQAHHLVTAAVGQDGVWPAHELVEPPEPANLFVPGTKIEMVSVGEQDLHT